MAYDPKIIEPKWQAFWEEHCTFRAEIDPTRTKYYALDMFPYPSGAGLHVGHPEGYTATDILSRYKRMRGFNVLHPMGWDSYGLPAERYAMRTGIHPAITTAQNIETFRGQIRRLGFSYDWSRELATTDPHYVRWTQWIFLKLYERGLAYQAEVAVNWCAAQNTVLANEEVKDGKYVETGDPVVRRLMRQWMLRITAYADRLLDDLDELDWPESVKAMQRNWIGRSEGAQVTFRVDTGAAGAGVLDGGVSAGGAQDGGTVEGGTAAGGVLDGGAAAGSALDGGALAGSALDGGALAGGASVGGALAGGTAAGGVLHGGTLEGGASAGGALDGGASVGGALAGGASAGGALDGGASVGGALAGGTAAGGVLYGGTLDGGASAGAALAGGTAAGGVVYGGALDGGTAAGGTADGGAAAGSALAGGAMDGGALDGAALEVFTTRPDTLFGATYCVLAPEHKLLARIVSPAQRAAVDAYVARAAALGEAQRTDAGRQKTGVFTGAYAINPANGARLPVWVADYVLGGYGTGAIMAVPAHDQRDWEFAAAFALPVIQVVDGGAGVHDAAYEGDGVLVRSGFLDGMTVADAKRAMTAWLEQRGAGVARTTYRLRDWLFSRQRYWGEPIPVLRLADGSIMPLPEDSLPILPPALDDYTPAEGGEPPLARATDWVRTVVPGTDIPALRETNTMPQWAGSCWYYLRFLDPHNDREFVSRAAEQYWMPVDIYIGGAEHAVLHLLYARFWHKVLYDIGAVSTREPFRKLFNQGMILAFSYRDAQGRYYEPEEASERDGKFFADGSVELHRQVEKMSKSRFNVVNPDDVVDAYGADSVRLYEMFMGPLDVAKPWQMAGVTGVRRFLDRAWRLVCDEDDALHPLVAAGGDVPPDVLRLRHRTVEVVTEEIEGLRFNTAIARLMEFCNTLTAATVRPREVIETFVLLLAPFAPHLAEELWGKLGHSGSLAYVAWPSFDAALAQEERQEYVVQVNGKVRHRFQGVARLDGDALLAASRAEAAVVAQLAGKTVVKEIAVAGRLVNFVVR